MNEYRWVGGKQTSCISESLLSSGSPCPRVLCIRAWRGGIGGCPPLSPLDSSSLIIPMSSHHCVFPQFTLVLPSPPYPCLTFSSLFSYKAQN